ncbi:MAG: hypothetical protein WD232_09515, partial [Acidimicrobiales bacterium]
MPVLVLGQRCGLPVEVSAVDVSCVHAGMLSPPCDTGRVAAPLTSFWRLDPTPVVASNRQFGG